MGPGLTQKRFRGPVLGISLLALIATVFGIKPYAPSAVTDADIAYSRDYLEKHYAPMPDDWSWHEFQVTGGKFDGGTLRWGQAGPTDAPTLIFIPGFMMYAENYTPYYDQWRADGLRVVAVDLPGQGRSLRRRGNREKPYSGDFGLYGDAVAAFVTHIAQGTDGPLVLMGESFGGHAALRAVNDHDLPLDQLILVVPALGIASPDLPLPVVRAVTGTMTRLGFGGRYALGANNWALDWTIDGPSNAACGKRMDAVHMTEAFYTLDPALRVGGVTNEWVHGLETSGHRLTHSDSLTDLPFPVTTILAGKDKVVANDRPKALCETGMKNCELIMFDDAEHCMRLEPDPVIARLTQLVTTLAQTAAR